MSGLPDDLITRRSTGYVAASVGTLVGGFVGGTVGGLVGLPLAERVASDVKSSGESEGVEAVIEGFGASLGAVVLGAIVLLLAVVVVTWLGAVVGCGSALRVSGNDDASRTALLTGCVGPLILIVGAWVAQALAGSIEGATVYLVYGAAAVSAALIGRRLVLAHPARRHRGPAVPAAPPRGRART